jgi:tricorn protease
MNRRTRLRTGFAFLVAILATHVTFAAATEHALIRYPNTHGDSVVFVARDALWTVGEQGGLATKVPGVPAQPVAPRYSPDGRWIAFTAREKGNDDVFVMPAAGGAVRRLTWSADVSASVPAWWGPNNRVIAWSPDSKSILFLSRTTAVARSQPQLWQVSVEGGLPTRYLLSDAVSLSYSPDGTAAAITRTYAEYRPWKRYDGGLAPDISVYDFRSGKLRQLTDWKGTDAFPMWAGSKIYFLSDRDSSRRANLWVMDASGTNARELTHFNDGDIDFPSIGDGRIAFQQGGKLWLFDLTDGTAHPVTVDVPDDGMATRLRAVDLSTSIRAMDVTGMRNYAVAPDGRSIAFSALGDIVLVDTAGRTTNLTTTDGIDEDHPVFSPDGRFIAYVTDRSGEQQVVVRGLDGSAERPLTRSQSGYYYAPTWSDDGRVLLVADASHALWLLHANGEPAVRIAADPAAEIRDAAVSADGRRVAYSTLGANGQRVLHLFEVSSARDRVLSSDMFGDWQPRFASDGSALFFQSNRHSQPVMSDREVDMVPVRSAGIYRAPIRDGQVRMEDAEAVALPGGTYDLIGQRGDGLFVVAKPTSTPEGSLEGEVARLIRVDLATGKPGDVPVAADNPDVTYDGSTVAYSDGKTYHLLDRRSGKDMKIDLSGMRGSVVWQHVWAEMLENVWRLQRDMYYSPSMDGADWAGARASMRRLLPLLGSRSDFNYALGQLQGEVGSSHTYYNGARDAAPREPEALLGVDLVLDPKAGRYRIARIVPGDNSRPTLRSPLQAPGVDAHDGDYLLAINGTPLLPPRNPGELLAGLTGKLTLSLATGATGAPRNVVVTPLDSELNLRQFDFMQRSRAEVRRVSGGRIGYIYLANMSELGTSQFIDQFYAQQDKEGLIFDVRWNSGGFTSQLMLERLRRPLAGIFVNRQRACASMPDGLQIGVKAVLVNHYSASDGDQFPYFFREFGLGPVIGTRTWGGVRGILGAWPLMDGSSANVPKDVLVTPQGQRIIENDGTHPDIELDNDPVGDRDAQLERAVSELMPRLRPSPVAACPKPAP